MPELNFRDYKYICMTDGFRGVETRMNKKSNQLYYLGFLFRNGRRVNKSFETPEKAAAWVDRERLLLGLNQLNNTFKQRRVDQKT